MAATTRWRAIGERAMNFKAGDNRVFLLAHTVLLGVVLVGFARSFYLRELFLRNALDVPLQLHGIALTGWFGLVFVQAAAMTAGRRDLHRRLAWLVALILPAVVGTSLFINTRLSRTLASARDPENIFVWGNYMSLVAFVCLVTAAIALRRRPDAHRRLLLMASIAIVGPAFARFSFWPVFGLGLEGAPAFAIGGLLLMLALAVGVDLVRRGRVHPATWAGVGAILATLVTGIGIGVTGLGYQFLHAAR
jgi:hypothetical protein